MIHISIRNDAHDNPRLVVTQVPFWFDALSDWSSRWPLRNWYQKVMLWWWEKLDTYPQLEFPITGEQRSQISRVFWGQP